jgi:hypothetical protein
LAEGRPLAGQLGIHPDRPDSFAFVANGQAYVAAALPSSTKHEAPLITQATHWAIAVRDHLAEPLGFGCLLSSSSENTKEPAQ